MIRNILFLLVVVCPLFASEGKWTPQQVLELDPAWLREQGLELPPSRLWDPRRGTGLLAAAVNIPGCSAAFVSSTGLILTNHHCLFSILQEHSTPQKNIVRDGFLARTASEELRSKTIKAEIPRRFSDVTKDVLASIPPGADDLARAKAMESRQKELVAECEKRPGARCKVAAFDGGVRYVLIDALELDDVRLVYAPPRAIGEFGGEADNWMWPRHTGDFSIARVYDQSGAPYRPEFYLPISKTGVKAGDFVMVLGYPGLTFRSMLADEMAERRDLYYPRVVDYYGEMIRILEETTKGDARGEIAVASDLKSLQNRFKNAEGQLAGFRRGRLLEKQRAQEALIRQWVAQRPELRGSLEAREELIRITTDARVTWERDFLIGAIPLSAKALYFATTLVRAAEERAIPDAQRDPAYMERERPRLRDRLEREQKNYFERTDKARFAAWMNRARALPPSQSIAAAGAATDIDALYAATRVLDLAERLKMFEETREQLRARKDPLLDLAFALAGDIRALRERNERREGAIARLRPEWRKAVLAHAGKPIAPDANSTLRVTFGHVKGYEPRDGVVYKPQTMLAGLIEKYTGREPFDVPGPVLAAAGSAPDTPVNFLADADTTGGNSGSPVVNGKGELVGVNFDRVWENVANDFGYNPDIARNVSVDTRFLLWMLTRVSGAGDLARELTAR